MTSDLLVGIAIGFLNFGIRAVAVIFEVMRMAEFQIGKRAKLAN